MRVKRWFVMVAAVGVLAALGFATRGMGKALGGSSHGVAPYSGFVLLDADRTQSMAYLNFMYGLLYRDRGQREEAAARFAAACALDRVLQPSFESDHHPS